MLCYDPYPFQIVDAYKTGRGNRIMILLMKTKTETERLEISQKEKKIWLKVNLGFEFCVLFVILEAGPNRKKLSD